MRGFSTRQSDYPWLHVYAVADLSSGLPGPWPIHQNWQLILFIVKSINILPAQQDTEGVRKDE